MKFDPQSHLSELDKVGYTKLNGLFVDQLPRLRERVEQLFAEEGDRAGSEFRQEAGCRRLANLVDKGDVFHSLLLHSMIEPLAAHVLGDDFKLSSNNARSVPPGCSIRQPLHADMGAVADERGYWVCNTVWLLTDFTTENGAIRAVPGSHRSGKLPQDQMDDPLESHPDETLLTGRAGDVLVMNAHLWHGAVENRSDEHRTAIHVFYCRRDKPQQQYQRGMIRREVQAKLPSDLRLLLALDDPRNDQLSTENVRRSGFLPDNSPNK
ncbi:MAG: phytanoyl-CoA dioxygenase family protein [Pirellulaceae bacterium]|jgi:hypothetical protein|nr:phytanoyl-CoA dioxygenase family protein [Pirellulaceae bacterium]MDP7018632.1 phytanoyl-CoA dioxygenase family protein [Pirellulaceae bacterium]